MASWRAASPRETRRPARDGQSSMYIAPIDNQHWRDPKLVASHVLALREEEGLPTTPLLLVKTVYICHGWMLGLSD